MKKQKHITSTPLRVFSLGCSVEEQNLNKQLQCHQLHTTIRAWKEKTSSQVILKKQMFIINLVVTQHRVNLRYSEKQKSCSLFKTQTEVKVFFNSFQPGEHQKLFWSSEISFVWAVTHYKSSNLNLTVKTEISLLYIRQELRDSQLTAKLLTETTDSNFTLKLTDHPRCFPHAKMYNWTIFLTK